jgi:hypothetical protein
LAEMTVTVGLDMVSRVGVAVVSITNPGVVVVVVEIGLKLWALAKTLGARAVWSDVTCTLSTGRLLTQHLQCMPILPSRVFVT